MIPIRNKVESRCTPAKTFSPERWKVESVSNQVIKTLKLSPLPPGERLIYAPNWQEYVKRKMLNNSYVEGDKVQVPTLSTAVGYKVMEISPQGATQVTEETNVVVLQDSVEDGECKNLIQPNNISISPITFPIRCPFCEHTSIVQVQMDGKAVFYVHKFLETPPHG
jgi:hypothetical protein